MSGRGPRMADALAGAFAFARGRNPAMQGLHFDLDGYWHSFFAILPILPMVLLNHYILSVQFDDFTFEPLKHVVVTLIGWPVFAMGAMPLASALGFSDRYVALVVVDHWLTVIQTGLLVFPFVLLAVGLPAQMFQIFYSIGFLVSLWLGWRGYKLVLGRNGLAALCLVFSLVLNIAVNRFLMTILDKAGL